MRVAALYLDRDGRGKEKLSFTSYFRHTDKGLYSSLLKEGEGKKEGLSPFWLRRWIGGKRKVRSLLEIKEDVSASDLTPLSLYRKGGGREKSSLLLSLLDHTKGKK